MNEKFRSIMVSIVSLCLLVASAQMATAQERDRSRDVLQPLKQALQRAGAPELSDAQETRLENIIATYRESRREQEPSEALIAAERAFDNAIVAGDLTAAQAQATIIAQELAAASKARLDAEAGFKVQVLSVLTDTQKSTLLQQLGSVGVSRVLDALASSRGGDPRSGGGRDPRE
jgi:Spy/CpxP family protein refolding chaperone